MESWLATDLISDPAKAAIGGLGIGLLFGIFAQSSRFCLRSACIEFWGGRLGQHVAVWLFVFGSALLMVQIMMSEHVLVSSEVRQLATSGTLSGAAIGGLLFGAGMILARGCASRLLVLSATGNLRALMAGLVVTVAAQASLSGVLSPLRNWLSSLWIVDANLRNLMNFVPNGSGILLGGLIVALAAIIAFRAGIGWRRGMLAAGVGASVATGWWYTAALSHVSFTPITPSSVTFTGPSADTLMALITSPSIPLHFGIGLVPGVFAGSFLSSVLRREFKVQVFDADTGTLRYIVGASLMGFGGMLAGGCAVGAGVTGGSVLSMTAWLALLCMWIGAGVMEWMLRARDAEGGLSAHALSR
ncbi:MAG: YeeE/YedE family protein [Rhodospirillales bacterium]|nr:YeeE/YedE family protein [Rhodospirillales bacterium]MBO6787841.1 YeeE/YedE family protein [Rhodospirillales bacterium]